jgi:hypothetical protein
MRVGFEQSDWSHSISGGPGASKQPAEDNSHAGQGPVLLDIGDDVGAAIIRMPAALAGQEIEIRPVLPGESRHRADDRFGARTHLHTHRGPLAHDHLQHVGVVGRPVAAGLQFSAVFGALTSGEYELYVRPAGPVQLRVTVTGGEVSFVDWPALDE